MKKIYTVLFLLSLQVAIAQFFTGSNLPIVLITTAALDTIKDDPRIVAQMKIIYRGEGQRNLLTDQDSSIYLNYNGPVTIEIRGSSSQLLPKKQYGFSTKKLDGVTNNNVSLLGMPKDNDWILNGFAFDPSLMRDYLSYYLARSMGNYAVRGQYCEVMINGSYMGLYLLQEKIKQGSGRVDIAKIDSSDTAFPDITGGYITKADKLEKGDVLAWKRPGNNGVFDLNFQHVLPKPEEVVAEQTTYIKSQFDNLERLAVNGNTSIVDGYPSVIDIPSFLDFMIINELASNVDGYHFSTFFNKDRQGKLKAGPIWDFNLTYGNDLKFWKLDRSKTNVWQFNNGDNEGSVFWKGLFLDPKFRCEMAHRWNELQKPGNALHIDVIEAFIDKTATHIEEAAQRERYTWGSLADLPTHVSEIKTFLRKRITWINSNLGSFVNCRTVKTYPLVIDKIMYNPEDSPFGESDDQEFIGIRNVSDQTIDLTGIYFGGYGLSYTFPANSSIKPQSEIILTSDANVFTAKYGFIPFGEYARNLSNGGQKVSLLDAWGNVIDEVDYRDESPWPDADGNGSFLELISPDLDNSLAINWSAGNVLVGLDDEVHHAGVSIYPSLVHDALHVESQDAINEILLYDIQGHTLQHKSVGAYVYTFDMQDYAKGIYFVKVNTSQGSNTQKVVKQ